MDRIFLFFIHAGFGDIKVLEVSKTQKRKKTSHIYHSHRFRDDDGLFPRPRGAGGDDRVVLLAGVVLLTTRSSSRSRR